MAAPKGHPRYGGRAKGVANRKTQTLEQFLDASGMFVPERIMQLLPNLEDRDQAKVLLELMQYLYPKRKSMEISGQIETNPFKGQPLGELKELAKEHVFK